MGVAVKEMFTQLVCFGSVSGAVNRLLRSHDILMLLDSIKTSNNGVTSQSSTVLIILTFCRFMLEINANQNPTRL